MKKLLSLALILVLSLTALVGCGGGGGSTEEGAADPVTVGFILHRTLLVTADSLMLSHCRGRLYL